MSERKIVLEIFYARGGVDYMGYSYEAEPGERLEQRDIAWLMMAAYSELLHEIEMPARDNGNTRQV